MLLWPLSLDTMVLFQLKYTMMPQLKFTRVLLSPQRPQPLQLLLSQPTPQDTRLPTLYRMRPRALTLKAINHLEQVHRSHSWEVDICQLDCGGMRRSQGVLHIISSQHTTRPASLTPRRTFDSI